jgi:ubiquinone/menaquinone biosynthesis C-methylase UbiE
LCKQAVSLGRVAFWDLQSYVWDDYLQVEECRQEVQIVAEWLSHSVETSAAILDVGCGTGSYSLALASLGHPVTGVDFSRSMLGRAERKAGSATPTPAVEFRHADFDRPLPFPAACFGGALAVAVLQCSSDPAHFLREVARVLTARGVFLLVAVDPAQRSAAKPKLKSSAIRWLVRRVKSLGNRAVHRCSNDELVCLLNDAGFTVCEQRSWPGVMGYLCLLRSNS